MMFLTALIDRNKHVIECFKCGFSHMVKWIKLDDIDMYTYIWIPY